MSEFDEYAGLFAEQGDFDIPSNWVIGIAIKPTENLDIAVDVPAGPLQQDPRRSPTR